MGSIPGSGRSPEGGHGNPLQARQLLLPGESHGQRSQSVGQDLSNLTCTNILYAWWDTPLLCILHPPLWRLPRVYCRTLNIMHCLLDRISFHFWKLVFPLLRDDLVVWSLPLPVGSLQSCQPLFTDFILVFIWNFAKIYWQEHSLMVIGGRHDPSIFTHNSVSNLRKIQQAEFRKLDFCLVSNSIGKAI